MIQPVFQLLRQLPCIGKAAIVFAISPGRYHPAQLIEQPDGVHGSQIGLYQPFGTAVHAGNAFIDRPLDFLQVPVLFLRIVKQIQLLRNIGFVILRKFSHTQLPETDCRLPAKSALAGG